MKGKKKVIYLVLAAVLAIGTVFGSSMTPVSASGAKVKAGSTFTSGKYRYKVLSISKKSGTVSLIGPKSKSVTRVKMPNTVKKSGYAFKVTEIGNGAFKGCKKLKSITTNKALKKIGKNAFLGCKKLKSIGIVSSGLKSVGKNALKGISPKAVIDVPAGKEAAYKKVFKAKGQKASVTIQSPDPAQTISVPQSPQLPQSPESEEGQEPTVIPKPDATAGEHTHIFSDWKVVQDATCTENGWKRASCSVCGEEEEVKIPALGHSFGAYAYNEDATCTEDGTETATCSRCGATDTRSAVETKTPHNFGGWEVKESASCEKAGVKERVCQDCGMAEEEPIAVLGHDMKDEEIIAPTCTKDGRVVRGGRCSRCGYEGKETVLPALGHSFTEYAYNEDATCTADGTETATCDRCEATDTREAAGTQTAHRYGAWKEEVQPSCTEAGSKTRVCEECGDIETEEIPALGHSFTEYVYNEDATCAADGTETAACDRCGATDTRVATGTQTAHCYGAWKEEAQPTCTEAGSKTRVCEECGNAQTEEIAALGHDMQPVEGAAATCTEPGWTVPGGRCSRCGYGKPIELIPALGHSFTEYAYNEDATCAADGTETANCDRCEATDTRVATGTKTAHRYGAWKEEISPTCTEVGSKTRVCEECGDAQTEEIAALGHDMKDEEIIAPTCTKDGQVVRGGRCSRCGYGKPIELIPALGHSFTDYVYNEDATCAADGTETAACDRCGATDTRVAAGTQTAHRYDAWKEEAQPTCTEAGSKTRVCEECGNAQTEEIAALGHDMQPVEGAAATCTEPGWTVPGGRCSRCGYGKPIELIPALGHSFTEYAYNEDATCAADGTETATCDRCEATDTRVATGTKTAHRYGAWKEEISPTCTEVGSKTRVCEECGDAQTEEIAALGHDMQPVGIIAPTCEKKGWEYPDGRCSRCGHLGPAKPIPALGHSFGAYVYNEDATCTKDGTETAICTVCGAADTRTKAGTKKAHVYGEWVVKKAADSCAAPGYKERKCTVCGTAQGQYIDPPAHTLVETGSQEATCLGYGRQYSECVVCGQVFFHVTDRPLGHDWAEKTVEPTCTEKGYTALECTRCHEKKDVVETEALGHIYEEEWVTDREATCKEPGQKSRGCSRCGYRETEEIPRTEDHQYVDNQPCSCAAPGYWDKICAICGKKSGQYLKAPDHKLKQTFSTEATCLDYGKQYSECTECGQVFFHVTDRPLGHDWVEKRVEPTCTESGYSLMECSRCHEKKDWTELPALGHDYSGEWVVEKEATCTEPGQSSIGCSRCGQRKTDATPAEGGHKYEVERVIVEPTDDTPGIAAVKCKICGAVDEWYEIPAKGRQWEEEGQEQERAKAAALIAGDFKLIGNTLAGVSGAWKPSVFIT